MKTMLICALGCLLCWVNPAAAKDRTSLGWGHLLTNDVIGDNRDRWRTGSLVLSHVRGPEWTGALPTRFGELIEYRFRGEVISPERIRAPLANDRRYVGALSFGAHTHWSRGETAMSLGLDVIFVGPQTNLDDVQKKLHSIFGGPTPNVANFQVKNAIYPTVTFEAGRSFDIGDNSDIRPFVELQAGAETLARIGADLTWGGFGKGGLRLRDLSTGQRYSGITGVQPLGLSFFAGGDVAYVVDSRYLATPGIVAEDMRGRVRLGFHNGWKRGGIFYGLTYLSEEIEAQTEGQYLGSVSARFRF